MSTPLEADSLRERELSKLDTAASVVMTKELFEKLYLQPETRVAGRLRKTFGNPTPLGLAGFLLALTPLACDLMGWRGAGDLGSAGAASVGAFYFFGGIIALLVAIGEFILGNSFSVVMFGVYGGWFLTYGAVLTPAFNAVAAYTDPKNPTANPKFSPSFLASLAYLLVFMAVFNFVMLICSIRTNIIFVLVFVCLECTFSFIASSYFFAADADILTYKNYQIIGGGFAFAACMLGWYLFIAEMFAIIDFPIQLPVGDLSTIVKGASERSSVKTKHNMV